jgi:flagellar hook-basal body complex protein FliE
MAINPVALSGMTSLLPPTALTPSSGTSGAAQGNLFDQLLGSAANSHARAEQAVHNMAAGETDNLHGVMLHMANADLSFRLILEIRNRLTSAYQEIMKMQV